MTRIRVGAGAVVLGALMLALGPLAATGGAEEGGFTACPAGTEKLVKFEADGWKAEGGASSPVTLIDPSLTGGSWTSTVPIAVVVVKGGSGEQSLDYIEYDPHATSGVYSNAFLLNKGDQVPEISFVEFCTAEEEETTTTSSTSTTTTSTSTTTTSTSTTTTTTAAPAVEGESVEIPTEVKGAVELAELPRTGAPAVAGMLSVLGAGLLVGGLGLLAAGRRPERRA